MKPKLSKSLVALREAIDDSFPSRSRVSDGTLGDSKHQKRGSKSDHNPDAQGWVRAFDCTARLDDNPETMSYLVNQLREVAKRDGRLSYIIYQGKICSPILNWKWRNYKGASPHNHHAHFSFKKSADMDTRSFHIIPMLGANND